MAKSNFTDGPADDVAPSEGYDTTAAQGTSFDAAQGTTTGTTTGEPGAAETSSDLPKGVTLVKPYNGEVADRSGREQADKIAAEDAKLRAENPNLVVHREPVGGVGGGSFDAGRPMTDEEKAKAAQQQ